MICPYCRSKEAQLQKWTQEPSADNETMITSGTTATTINFVQMECQRENCGAFYDGRCHYMNG